MGVAEAIETHLAQTQEQMAIAEVPVVGGVVVLHQVLAVLETLLL